MSVQGGTSKLRESGWWEVAKIIVQALALAMIVRVFFYQPFNIPSGSMKPTLLVGDYLFVSKLSYGYSKYSFPLTPFDFSGRVLAGTPKRGDVVVFRLPRDNETDYIKRVIGLPGDTVQMQDGVLIINGKAIPKKRTGSFETHDEDGRLISIPMFEETLPNGVTYKVLDEDPDGPADNTRVFTVPEGHYFMMGDNRDNSTDSRIPWGGVDYVPHENLIGRADIIFFSAAFDDPDAFRLLTPWQWPLDIRWRRFFDVVR
ncbi:MAG: signal peptidase I [Pseudomonadota bacterium]